MAWARIDDAFDDHAKVLALLDLDEGVAAVGLWTLCLTYAHRNTRKKGKTPGLIPTTLPRRFVGSAGKALAGLLVEVGLWDEVDDGWMIHDFAEYLPDKEVSAARSAAGKKGAASRWGNKEADGNLPSVDGKSYGKSVASDGTSKAEVAPRANTPAEHEPALPGNGNEPSSDGNLPSPSHSSDGKAMASDGSRAGARRARVDVRTSVLFPDPSPEPVPPSAGGGKPRPDVEITAGVIVAEWLERCAKRPPSSVIGQIGKHVKAMLTEGIDADDIRRGVAAWMTRKIAANHLPGVVNDVMNAPAAGATRSPANGHQPYRNPQDPSVYFEDL